MASLCLGRAGACVVAVRLWRHEHSWAGLNVYDVAQRLSSPSPLRPKRRRRNRWSGTVFKSKHPQFSERFLTRFHIPVTSTAGRLKRHQQRLSERDRTSVLGDFISSQLLFLLTNHRYRASSFWLPHHFKLSAFLTQSDRAFSCYFNTNPIIYFPLQLTSLLLFSCCPLTDERRSFDTISATSNSDSMRGFAFIQKHILLRLIVFCTSFMTDQLRAGAVFYFVYFLHFFFY